MMKRYIGFFTLLCLCVFQPVVSAATRLTKMQALNLGSYTRVIISVNDPNRYHVFTLANPDRLVIDFNNAHLTTRLQDVHFSDGNLIQVRSGHPTSKVLRLVFDMNGSARFKSFMALGNNHHEAQLVVDVFPSATRYPASVTHLVAISSKKIAAVPSAKQTALQDPATTKPRKIVIVIDAGHGGKDPGTVGADGAKEKTIVLDIARRLAILVSNEPNMRVVMTRSRDRFVSLRHRLMLARKSHGDVFISIHADSFLDDHSEGASVYALSRNGATTEAARWLARHENDSELGGVNMNGLDDQSYLLRSVLIDLSQTATITDSLRLGTQTLDELGKVTSLHHRQVDQAPFVVLKSPDIPSILVETGFLSNPKEEKRLRTKEYREVLALALLNGIHSYVVTHPSIASNERPRLLT
jgi:N-acetylmuramoyl-L-alanine amidase